MGRIAIWNLISMEIEKALVEEPRKRDDDEEPVADQGLIVQVRVKRVATAPAGKIDADLLIVASAGIPACWAGSVLGTAKPIADLFINELRIGGISGHQITGKTVVLVSFDERVSDQYIIDLAEIVDGIVNAPDTLILDSISRQTLRSYDDTIEDTDSLRGIATRAAQKHFSGLKPLEDGVPVRGLLASLLVNREIGGQRAAYIAAVQEEYETSAFEAKKFHAIQRFPTLLGSCTPNDQELLRLVKLANKRSSRSGCYV
eukprot:TRINITY_DN1197_c0_g2_i1.p1 TRINITY_DN1197_c0_g2~~TRINITY_DN1197_c0_g2_i1.p1  ORF type:complete len:284 (+),score=77.73 TRINITY_DN1197_c0_g2_i1:76-852(+)